MSVQKVFVDCLKDGSRIATYEFGYGETLDKTPPPHSSALIEEAKTSLTLERKAFPPYEGIEFKIRYQ
ncbi:hypothetical protein [Herbaspirillum sp. VT-16-41]|uniref:hypothetical protein n=1 Tax=Herbaspirillum sp. VT-16-41 TaxID=1953765 RepID=UPI001115896F|nr:hypothetical protein [Herbaspirillum sp. VT-16-41]